MKLYFKQKAFSLSQSTTVTDEFGNVMFTGKSEILSIGRKMHIYDDMNNEVAFIQQKLLTLMPRFSVFLGDEHIADVVKEFHLFKQDYRVEGLNWTIDGDYMAHDYTIRYGGRYLASIHKKWMAWGDSFEVDIANDRDILMVVAVIVAIDCVIDNSQSSR